MGSTQGLLQFSRQQQFTLTSVLARGYTPCIRSESLVCKNSKEKASTSSWHLPRIEGIQKESHRKTLI